MIPSAEGVLADRKKQVRDTQPRNVEISAARESVRVTLSIPADGSRSTDRRKVLERARRMLAVALEDERRQEAADRAREETARPTEARPACGAWWLF